MDKNSREYEVCPCNHITRGEIEDCVRKTKVNDLKKLCELTGAGTKCGGCRETLEEIMNKVLAEG